MPTKRERQPHGAAAAREVGAYDMSTAELPPVCVFHTLLIIMRLRLATAHCAVPRRSESLQWCLTTATSATWEGRERQGRWIPLTTNDAIRTPLPSPSRPLM